MPLSNPFGEVIFRATVAVPGDNEATIIPLGTSVATQRPYKYALDGMQLAAGDDVYVIPISGTYVLLGGAVAGGGGGEVTRAEFDALSDDVDALSGDVDDLGDTVAAEIAGRNTTDTAIERGLAIVAVGNSHAAIASGQYVYIKGHGTLAEGLYKATAAIPLDGTLSSTNVSAASGVLNDLTTVEQIPVTVSSTDTRLLPTTTATCYRCGKIAILSILSHWNFSANPFEPGINGQVVMRVTGAPQTFAYMRSIAFAGTRLFIGWWQANGTVTVRNFSEAYSSSNGPISISFFYLCA